MSWIFATILLLVTFAIAFQVWVLRKAKKMEGQPAPRLAAGGVEIDADKPCLLYFHSPKCAPCRRMSPLIDELSSAYPGRVASMDVSEHPEAAGEYGVRATPTTVLVRDGEIAKVMLGFQPVARLRSLLDG